MRVKEITVTSGLVLPHPKIQYSTLKPQLSITAELAEGENVAEAHIRLRHECDNLLRAHGLEMVRCAREVSQKNIKE